MKTYTKEELDEILKNHSLWLVDSTTGERANLSSANLRSADLSYADLRSANLRYADLSYANLSYANLRSANLSYADLDFSCWSLSCDSLNVNVDEKLFYQLLFHTLSLKGLSQSEDFRKVYKTCKDIANKFHRTEIARLEDLPDQAEAERGQK